MPDYDIDREKCSVAVTIYGKMIDEKYTNLLKSEKGQKLSLRECIMLDAVQKRKPLNDEAIKYLKDKKLIEGSRGNYFISLSVAKLTNQVGQYTRNKGLAYNALVMLILQLAYNAGEIGFKKSQAFEALENSLPSSKDQKAKQVYLGHVLTKMAIEGLIKPNGRTWFITEKGCHELAK